MVSFQVDENIELHSFEDYHTDELFEVVKANYNHLRPFLHWVTPSYSLDSAREFIEQTQKAVIDKTSEPFAIIYQGNLIGVIGFVSFSWNSKRTEIGYWISKEFEGRGSITKCCKYLVNYAFDKLEMNRIEIRGATENIRSRAIPERLGFKLEGILRQSVWRHTRFQDMAIYALLAEDWESNEK